MWVTQPVTKVNIKKYLVVKRVRRASLKTLLQSVSRLFRQCGILNISLPYRAPRSFTGIDVLNFTDICVVMQNSSLNSKEHMAPISIVEKTLGRYKL
jgi:hypothetical protein